MKALIIILSSTWKFAATFPIAVYIFKMSFWETILYTNTGGLIGIILSIYLSKIIIILWNAFGPEKFSFKKKNSKIFTKRNRFIVKLKIKYGLPGIVILTPVILSIPIGTFLTTKYYGSDKKSYLYLFLGQVAWSFLYTAVYNKLITLL